MKGRASAVLGCLVAAWSGAARAEPGASCADPLPFGPPGVVAGSTEGAAGGAPSSCGVSDEQAAWYSFKAPEQARYTFTTGENPGLVDTTIELRSGCGGAPLLCNDDAKNSLRASVDLDMLAGQQVLVRVAGWGGTRGPFSLTIDRPEALDRPVNDECEGAIALAYPGRVQATTLHATGVDVSSCGGEDASDLWFTFVAPEKKEYQFYLTQQSTAANLVAVYKSCEADELSCGLAAASASLDAGQKVWVRVGSSPDVADWFNLNVGPAAPAVAPPNDSIGGAIPVAVPSTTEGTLVGATQDGLGFGPSCGPNVQAAVWYSFTAPEDGIYVFDTSDSEVEDTVLAVFECPADGKPPALLGCDNDSGKGLRSRIDGEIKAGQKVCIGVAGNYLSPDGKFTLKVSSPPPTPANSHCEQAAPLKGQVTQENYSSAPEAPATLCPSDNFALWYAFTAEADGDYKFDTKLNEESSPELALFSSCGAEPLSCSQDPWPVAHRSMKAGESILVRVATNVFWRAPLTLRVSPLLEGEGGGQGGAGGEAGAGQAGSGGAGAGGSAAGQGGAGGAGEAGSGQAGAGESGASGQAGGAGGAGAVAGAAGAAGGEPGGAGGKAGAGGAAGSAAQGGAAGSEAGAAGEPGAGGQGGDGGPAVAPVTPDEGGCGCRVAPGGAGDGRGLALAALGLAGLARRRARVRAGR